MLSGALQLEGIRSALDTETEIRIRKIINSVFILVLLMNVHTCEIIKLNINYKLILKTSSKNYMKISWIKVTLALVN